MLFMWNSNEHIIQRDTEGFWERHPCWNVSNQYQPVHDWFPCSVHLYIIHGCGHNTSICNYFLQRCYFIVGTHFIVSKINWLFYFIYIGICTFPFLSFGKGGGVTIFSKKNIPTIPFVTLQLASEKCNLIKAVESILNRISPLSEILLTYRII